MDGIRDGASVAAGPARQHRPRAELDRWPSHLDGVELIWHRLNRTHDLRRFLRSNVRWAECDSRLAPSGSIVVSHSAGTRGDRPFADWLDEVAANGRGRRST